MSEDELSDFRVDAQRLGSFWNPEEALEPERVDLRPGQRDPGHRVDPTPCQILPGSFNLWKGHARLSEEVGEPVEALAQGMPVAQPAAQRGEHDSVLGVDGIDWARASGNVQKPQGRPFHVPPS